MFQLKKHLKELLLELEAEANQLKYANARKRYQDLKLIIYSQRNVEQACLSGTQCFLIFIWF